MNDPRIGKTIGGCRIESLIGKGGMGAVYLAHQLHLDRKVAVKLLLSSLLGNEKETKDALVKRFRQEAFFAAKLQHPNAVQIYDFGEQEDTYYIVMQYIDGKNLEELLKERGALSIEDCLYIVKEVARALKAAHELGIVHRDIKPANIMMRRDRSIVVTDFGLAKNLRLLTGISSAGDCIGTIGYMSPEQASGTPEIDHRSDIYSLGATVFHLVAGRRPFEGKNPVEIIYKQVTSDPPGISEFRKDLPMPFIKLVHKMMERDVKKRFQNAQELISTLERLEKMSAFSLPRVASSQRIRTRVRAITQLLSSSLLPGEEALSIKLQTCLNLKRINHCAASGCEKEWTIDKIALKEALLYKQKVWCPGCLWKELPYTMANAKIGMFDTASFGDYWLAIKGTEEFMPGEPIRLLYRFPLENPRKGWETMLKRIERGFSLVNKIHSNGLLQVGTYTECPEIKMAYVPIEYVAGTTLDLFLDLLAGRNMNLSLEENLAILRKLAHTLHVLHSNNVVHRNVSPHSVYLTINGGIRLGNFTMAKASPAAQPITQKVAGSFKEYCMEYWGGEDALFESGQEENITKNMKCVLGTVAYMSPEQTHGVSQVDRRSDIWSWGVIAFELLEGKRPFPEESVWSTVQRIREGKISEFSREIPPALQRIVYTALEVNLEKRYQWANDIVKHLDLLIK